MARRRTRAGARSGDGAQHSTLAVHRRARYDYEVLARLDAGIVLLGSEIKSIRDGRVSIAEGYAALRGGELWLHNVHIAPYPPARDQHEPLRPRKLLLHRRELDHLERQLREQQRTTVIPLRLYLQRGRVKVEIGLARGRRVYDKRQVIAKRDADRTIQRAMRHEVRGASEGRDAT